MLEIMDTEIDLLKNSLLVESKLENLIRYIEYKDNYLIYLCFSFLIYKIHKPMP